ncbi:hypothetical protein CRUP_011635 [Coryphaenoides rupestris]|nr:hypothetical protein CRUP_011635 [Coryphaenoides rupestris]
MVASGGLNWGSSRAGHTLASRGLRVPPAPMGSSSSGGAQQEPAPPDADSSRVWLMSCCTRSTFWFQSSSWGGPSSQAFSAAVFRAAEPIQVLVFRCSFVVILVIIIFLALGVSWRQQVVAPGLKPLTQLPVQGHPLPPQAVWLSSGSTARPSGGSGGWAAAAEGRVSSWMREGSLASSVIWSSFSREKIPGLFPQLSAVEWALELDVPAASSSSFWAAALSAQGLSILISPSASLPSSPEVDRDEGPEPGAVGGPAPITSSAGSVSASSSSPWMPRSWSRSACRAEGTGVCCLSERDSTPELLSRPSSWKSSSSTFSQLSRPLSVTPSLCISTSSSSSCSSSRSCCWNTCRSRCSSALSELTSMSSMRSSSSSSSSSSSLASVSTLGDPMKFPSPSEPRRLESTRASELWVPSSRAMCWVLLRSDSPCLLLTSSDSMPDSGSSPCQPADPPKPKGRAWRSSEGWELLASVCRDEGWWPRRRCSSSSSSSSLSSSSLISSSAFSTATSFSAGEIRGPEVKSAM